MTGSIYRSDIRVIAEGVLLYEPLLLCRETMHPLSWQLQTFNDGIDERGTLTTRCRKVDIENLIVRMLSWMHSKFRL